MLSIKICLNQKKSLAAPLKTVRCTMEAPTILQVISRCSQKLSAYGAIVILILNVIIA